ncbi:centrosomal protein of 135 kDa-like [Myripristis murdjan]|uniref:centrosomal protein of 135 kDa-like n=1 Tax=Myripristis murdjan TaxID=586833 RepID=UPI001175E85C|nr:centrosomal protein of 135 kDa-like [Myripristis murdjan]
MSMDIYAKPDLAQKVRYNRGAGEGGEEWEERPVVIYESADTYRDHQSDLLTHTDNIQNATREQDGEQHSEKQLPASIHRSSSRAAAVSLGLLALLLAAGIIVLSINYNLVLERDNLNTSHSQLQTSYHNLTEERDQLQTSYHNLIEERDQLQTSYHNLTEERDQLQTSYHNLTEDSDQLQTSYHSLIEAIHWLQTIYHSLTKERDQLQTSYHSLTEERDQLQTSYHSLTEERDQLQTSYHNLIEERDQLQTSYHSLTEERDQLQTSYHSLTEERDQLQTEVNELKRHIEGKWCPEGWNRFGCSCYYTSTESDTWWQSREKCQKQGADLVVINSKEEQMSMDIYAKPDLGKKVRYNRGAGEGGEEWEERPVVIYESADTYRDHQSDLLTHTDDVQNATGGQDGEQHSEKQLPASIHRSSSRAAAVSLGLLALLLAAGIIVLSINYISVIMERDNLVLERNNLNTSHSQLQTSYHSLTEERDQLQTSYHSLTEERDQLQTSYHSLIEERDQLQTEVNELKRHIEERSCPEGWNRFGCSCYYTSTESDTWWQSREKCQSKGADLVVINSKEEQDFVRGLKMKGASWIGLWTEWKQQSWTWEWVDKSPITVTYWRSQPQNPRSQATASCCEGGHWTEVDNYETNYWICEKQILYLL